MLVLRTGKRLASFALTLVIAAAANTASGQTVNDVGNGLQTAEFTTPNGKVTVYLPSDIRAGDTISGTVVAQPNGKTEAERSVNMSALRGVVVSSGGSKANPGQGIYATAAIGIVKLTMESAGGLPQSTQIPVKPAAPVPNAFTPDPVAEVGKVCEIPGPFDGNYANTVTKIGEMPVTTLAESTRGSYGLVPADCGLGKQTLSITEGDQQFSADVHTAKVSLVGTEKMHTGEKGDVSIEIRGLDLCGTPVSITLENRSRQTVDITWPGASRQGNTFVYVANPSEESTGGVMSFALGMTALAPGGFELLCNLAGNLCGAQTHELFIEKLAKKRKDGKYYVEWREDCYIGTCHLKKNHAGDHKYSWKKCKDHDSKEHNEEFADAESRDARYRELEKEQKARDAKWGR
jgi:hypothetical protein